MKKKDLYTRNKTKQDDQNYGRWIQNCLYRPGVTSYNFNPISPEEKSGRAQWVRGQSTEWVPDQPGPYSQSLSQTAREIQTLYSWLSWPSWQYRQTMVKCASSYSTEVQNFFCAGSPGISLLDVPLCVTRRPRWVTTFKHRLGRHMASCFSVFAKRSPQSSRPYISEVTVHISQVKH